MEKIDRSIFRDYDIRGIYGEQLTEELTEAIGRAAGTLFREAKINEAVVGCDNRISSPSLSQSLIKGLLSTGCNVCDVGLTLTPMVYFSWYGLKADAAIMVTASHNPARFNGFKVTMKKDIVEGFKIANVIESGHFEKGQGQIRQADLTKPYFAEITGKVHLKRSLKVVIDAGNGTAGVFAPDLFRQLGCEVLELFCQSDGNFPNHDPYPQKVEYYQKLVELVRQNQADLGIALDGDADRFNVCDEKGNFLGSDVLIAIFAKEILKENPGSKVVVNVVNSQSVIDFIKQVGGVPIIWKVGYPNIQRKLRQENALLGGEISGHLYFADRYFGFDDALYTAVRLAELVASSNQKLSQIDSKISSLLPGYFSTQEERIDCSDEKKFKIVGEIAGEWKKNFSDVLDIDGARVQFADGWGLVRASNTEPRLSIRAEAKTPQRLEEIKHLISQALEPYRPQVNLVWH